MKNKIYAIAILVLSSITVFGQAPAWQWAKSAGGNGGEFLRSINTDGNGNSYITGSFGTTIAFDSIVLINPDTAAGFSNIFYAKYDSTGHAVWAHNANAYDCYSLAADANENVYFIGHFNINCPAVTFNGITLTNTSASDAFIIKCDPLGNAIWGRTIAASAAWQYVIGSNIKLDADDNIYVTGNFSSPTITFGSTVLTTNGGSDIFIAKYDSSGSLIWARNAGGTDDEYSYGLAVDSNGNSAITGMFSSFDFTLGSDTLVNTASSYSDIYIAKYDSSGTALWAHSAKGSTEDRGTSISVDAIGSTNISGYFASPTIIFGIDTLINPDTTGYIPNVFNARYDAAGNVVWVKNVYNGTGIGTAIASDANGNSYVAGYFRGTAITFGSTVLTNADSTGTKTDAFVVKYDSTGNILWAKGSGGTDEDLATCITANGNGNIQMGGLFRSSAITFDTVTLANFAPGSDDVFFSKLNSIIPNTNCTAHFTLYPDTSTQHNWFALNQASGTGPLNYTWSWGDGNTSTGATPSHTYAAAGYYNICLTITDSTGCTSTYCDSSTYIYKGNSNSMVTLNVVTQLPTGIENIDGASLVTLYPNPATNYLTVSLPKISQKVNVVISDITGKAVYNITDASTQKLEVNTKDFSDGIYFVRIQTADFVETKKLIIQK